MSAPPQPSPDSHTRGSALHARLRQLQPAGGKAEPPPPTAAARSPRQRLLLRTPDEQRSLFGEILDWMLAPLLIVWPISITFTYVVAQSVADAPFDRNLGEAVTLLSDHVKLDRGKITLDLPVSAREVLRADVTDQVYYLVLGLSGEWVAGDRDLPIPPEDEPPHSGGPVQFRSDQLRGIDVRIAYTWVELRVADKPRYVLVEVGETLEKRSQLANEIIRGVIVPQFIVLPLAVLLVWFGLTRGLQPLEALRRRIRARRPDDLSPIDPRAAPEELGPLVVSFNELLARLAGSIETQKRFLADAAHQMKTPLAGLRTQAELALRERDPEQLKRSLRQIGAASERAAHLVDQLLTLARAEHQGQDPGAFEVIDLARLVRERVQEWVPAAMERQIDLGLEAPEAAVPIVGGALQIGEMLKNLIDNALRYTPHGGTVTVRVRAGQPVVLEVEDSGPGIPETERTLVFERFYRVLGTNVDGSGLGLAIVHEIVQQHEARINLTASPDSKDPALPGLLVRVEFCHVPPEERSENKSQGEP
ncbi:MAG: sensor histidine kinase N-terminal domain-containing protein [Burkholderiaceae bacterium]